jgi:6-pyruvoyltetrahydropterin/6-carboxytetrahydropterin synthase
VITTVTRSFEFDAAHRVLGHEGKCRHLHGHRYRVEVTVRASELNTLGMVVDFSRVKSALQPWIDDRWDHNVILNENDPLAVLFRNMGDKRILLADAFTEEGMGFIDPVFNGKEPLILKDNPTAEIIAEQFFLRASKELNLKSVGMEVVKVRVFETPNCWADYKGSPPC